jgi:putative flippase GtrA
MTSATDVEPAARARLRSLTGLVRESAWYIAAGAGSTATHAVLFMLLRGPLGAFPANLGAIVLTTVANTEFHRKVTFEAADSPKRRRAVAIALTVAFYASYSSMALLLLHMAVPSPTAVQQTATIIIAATLGGLARFALLRTWVFSAR